MFTFSNAPYPCTRNQRIVQIWPWDSHLITQLLKSVGEVLNFQHSVGGSFAFWTLHPRLCTLDSLLQDCPLFSSWLMAGLSSPESYTFPDATSNPWEICLHTDPLYCFSDPFLEPPSLSTGSEAGVHFTHWTPVLPLSVAQGHLSHWGCLLCYAHSCLAFRRHSTNTFKEMNLWIKSLCSSAFYGSENTHKRDMRTLL